MSLYGYEVAGFKVRYAVKHSSLLSDGQQG
jgi:hypothetical protein